MSERSLRIHEATLTHEGKVRKVNEDSVLARGADGLWAVADGMGGHANGQWASRAVVEALEKAQLPGDYDSATRTTADALHAANARIWAEGASLGQSMGSTVTALLLHGRRFAVFWAGDSRAYLQRRGGLYRLTTDHSQVQELVTAGHLTPEEAESHPMAHVLSRAVGVQPDLELEAVADEAQPGDTFLLCSDGLTRLVQDSELAGLLSSGAPAAVAEHLVGLCLERGAPDNVSVVIVGCDETTLLSFAAASSPDPEG
jgi:serine/threonine-protein phosphatase Stp1